MKKLVRQDIIDILMNSGINANKSNKIAGVLEISLARQATKKPGRSLIWEKSTLSELEESLRIGANLTPSEATKIIGEIVSTIKIQNDPEVKFLDAGTFEVAPNALKFKRML